MEFMGYNFSFDSQFFIHEFTKKSNHWRHHHS